MGGTSWFPVKILRAGAWRMLELLRWSKVAPPEQNMLRHIGYLRHVQHVRERGARQNPDGYVGHFITAFEKILARLEDIEQVRKNSLFHYLLARTRLYDRAVNDAINANFKQLVFIGVGSDTRAFRFRDALDDANVRVIESDIQPWLSQRKRLCRRIVQPREFYQLEFDLERMDSKNWTEIAHFDQNCKTLFVAEGVITYITKKAHASFLRWVSTSAPAGSCIAYDAKFSASRDISDQVTDENLFRMPQDRDEIIKVHREYGLDVKEIVPSATAQKRFTPYEAPIFDEDVFIAAAIRENAAPKPTRTAAA